MNDLIIALPQLPLAHHLFNPTLSVHNLRQMNIQCPSCKALHWLDECLTKSSKVNPKFGMCCYKGKISLPALQQPPANLYDLLTAQDPIGRAFRKYIQKYNSAL